jgi:VWFA-related protein
MRFTTFFVCVMLASGQQTGENKKPTDTPAMFSTSTSLVIELVTIKDKSGKVVEGLTAKDFTITEDGVPQEIKHFEFMKLPDTPNTTPLQFSSRDLANVQIMNKLPHATIVPETPGKLLYHDRRLMALYFDMTSMPPPDQIRALDAAEKFVKTQMQAADMVAIMEYEGGAVNVRLNFTDDRAKILSIIETMVVGEGQGLEDSVQDASAADTGAAFGQDDSEFNIFNTDRKLSALQTAAKMLGSLNEKKQLLYFASGMRLNGVDNQAQLHATINAAIRAGVSIWTIDARGLVASSPMGDASHGSPGGNAMYTGAAAAAFTTNFSSSQDTLYSIAADTGGKAFLDSNDLGKGIVNAEQSVSSYYIVGYYATNDKTDGKFRRIKISLAGQTANLDYRQGYFAGKVFSKFTTADKERQLEEALMLGDPVTELTMAMEVDFFQLNRAEYFVPLMVKIPGHELALARKGGFEHTVIDFIGEVKDEYGSTIQNIRDKVDYKLTDSTAEELSKRPIQYATGFTLLPGSYKVKILARDAETGHIGTYEIKFTIPNLDREEKRVPISSVVLSSQMIDMRDALYNATKDKDKSESSNPLVIDGQKLIPSVTRVFSKAKDMYIYLQAYERAATTTQPLVAFVTFYRGQVKAFETPPLAVTEGLVGKSKAVPLKFRVSLGQLQPGEYNCQVTVLDPTSQKAAFWTAPVMLVP